MEMDHWCTFANNVIGRGNRRSFVLFVTFIWLSSGYGAAMGLRHASALPVLRRTVAEMLPHEWSNMLGHFRMSGAVPAAGFKRGRGERAVDVNRDILLPVAMALICTLCFVMVSTLLWFQGRLLANGMTSVDYMQNDNRYQNRRGRTAGENIAAVMGRRWWLSWMLPLAQGELGAAEESHPEAAPVPLADIAAAKQESKRHKKVD